ncbi:MAG: ADP-ribosylglycohydrolase family protein [Alphaproteobacteria bacterium]|nr:ADP-ribosylglycohydrolase family protein [Alphaproteobacteria bacterium]MBO4643520.1 ADP-ribosylglycohydrolase family protein [Alphaproteobacteria bacterium]
MLGAIIGDIVGSVYEWQNIKTKEFQLFSDDARFTDDTVMTLAVGKALAECAGNYADLERQAIFFMQKYGGKYPYCGFGNQFFLWLKSDNPQPYNSWGNGSAMRVSACAYFARSLEEVKSLSFRVSAVSHNHPEGIKGAEATAVAVYLALQGNSKAEIREYIEKNYYRLNFNLDGIRPDYKFDVSCQGSVPQALEAFFEAQDFEDAIRNAVSIGGDSDTIAAIAGSVAAAYYPVPDGIRAQALQRLDEYLADTLFEIEKAMPKKQQS